MPPERALQVLERRIREAGVTGAVLTERPIDSLPPRLAGDVWARIGREGADLPAVLVDGEVVCCGLVDADAIVSACLRGRRG